MFYNNINIVQQEKTAYNTRLAQNHLFGGFGFHKTLFGLTPSAMFCSTTFLQPCKPSVCLFRLQKRRQSLTLYENWSGMIGKY
jgi:hypothetical protein